MHIGGDSTVVAHIVDGPGGGWSGLIIARPRVRIGWGEFVGDGISFGIVPSVSQCHPFSVRPESL